MTYNKSLKDLETKLTIIKQYKKGIPCTQISLLTGIPARTIQNFIARDTHQEFWDWWDEELSNNEVEEIEEYLKLLMVEKPGKMF